jgi:hypothetical protein
VSPGAAGGVERDAHGEPVKDFARDRLFDLEELVGLLVVPRGPPVIAVADGDRVRLGPGPERVRRFEQLPDLVEPRERELSVVAAGERAEKREPLKSEEIGERMLVDHWEFRCRVGHPGAPFFQKFLRALALKRCSVSAVRREAGNAQSAASMQKTYAIGIALRTYPGRA